MGLHTIKQSRRQSGNDIKANIARLINPNGQISGLLTILSNLFHPRSKTQNVPFSQTHPVTGSADGFNSHDRTSSAEPIAAKFRVIAASSPSAQARDY